MIADRLISSELNGKLRDTIELCLHNAVLGAGSLDGKQFAYANKLATCGDETAIRKDWFEGKPKRHLDREREIMVLTTPVIVCCCPPNLSRTLGMLGGYTWKASVDATSKTISLDILLFVSATRTIDLGNGETATATMKTEMPWQGKTSWELDAPKGWSWQVKLPSPHYAENIEVEGIASTPAESGFLAASTGDHAQLSMSFDMPIRLLAPHVLSGQDTLNVTRGPIVYIVESGDNKQLEASYKHFERIGISEAATFEQHPIEIGGIPMIGLTSSENSVFALEAEDVAYRQVNAKQPARRWKPLNTLLEFVPWFARANRGGDGRIRTALLRVGGQK